MSNADIIVSAPDPNPGAEGSDQGVGHANDYDMPTNNEYIGPESQPVKDDSKLPAKKDSVSKTPIKKEEDKPIGSPTDQSKEKKGFFKRIFGKKDKKN